MNWQQLKEHAELYRGSSVSHPKRWYNEAKAHLANEYVTACRLDATTIEATDIFADYSLPEGTKYVRRVADGDNRPVVLYSVDIPNATIRFSYPGRYSVTCAFETNNIVGNDSEIPQINSAYHYAIAKFIASKELEYSRPDRSRELLAEFYSESAKADRSLSRGRAGRFILPARRS